MRSNPSAAWDKSQSNTKHFRDAIAAARLPRFDGTSKSAAKTDNKSCHKARAWRCKGTFAVNRSQVRASKIEWI